MKTSRKPEAGQPEQYQLFETADYTYRVFVTDMDGPLATMVWFYNQRGGADNLIKEANNDAGLKAYPSNNWAVNAIHFQIAMLAYNLNCWLMLFNPEGTESAATLSHTTLATARLRFLFLATKIWRHGGQAGVRYSDHFQEQGIFQRLMGRLRAVARHDEGFAPVVAGITNSEGNLGEFRRGNRSRRHGQPSRPGGPEGCSACIIQVELVVCFKQTVDYSE